MPETQMPACLEPQRVAAFDRLLEQTVCCNNLLRQHVDCQASECSNAARQSLHHVSFEALMCQDTLYVDKAFVTNVDQACHVKPLDVPVASKPFLFLVQIFPSVQRNQSLARQAC